MTFQATILTLYPEMFPGPLGASIAGRAKDEGKWALNTVQIRDFATDKHRTVDDTPAGGGAGMVLKADVLARALDHAQSLCSGEGRSPGLDANPLERWQDPGLRRDDILKEHPSSAPW